MIKPLANLPHYQEVASDLVRSHLTLDPAEYHGALCGFLCAQPRSDFSEWNARIIRHFVGSDGFGATAAGADLSSDTLHLAEGLTSLFRVTEFQLDDADLSFELLLPADEGNALSVRAEALAAWCQGFLFGLTASGLEDFSALSQDANELIHDLVEISRSSYSDEELEDEESENALMEISEYVRVGVLLIRTELLHAERRPPQKTVH